VLLITLNPSNSTQCRAAASVLFSRRLATSPSPRHRRRIRRLATSPSPRHRRRICRPPSRHHYYRGMSSHRRHRIPSCRHRIASRHHQVSSSPPPPLSLQVLGAATVALVRMSRRRDALPRLTALPLRRRLGDALKTMTITSIQWTIKHCSITQLNLIYLRFLFITVYRYNELYLMT
jgi:hypothetical protein